MNLEELFVKYGTDKGYLGGSGWGYTEVYEKHLAFRRRDVANMLEIGICGYRDIPNNVVGASLFAWRDYFPGAYINGFDNDSRFIFNDHDQINTFLCNAYAEHELRHAVDAALTASSDYLFDFICDDAVHDPLNQMFLVRQLWPFLCKNGVYAIEDVCHYKVPNGDLGEHMIKPLMREFEDMTAVEYHTHKDERLIVLTKGS